MKQQRIIDMHAHIFPEKIVQKAVQSICNFYQTPMQGIGTTKDLLEKSKENKIERILVHSTATKADQVESINRYIISEINENKEFIGFGTLHPEYEDIEGAVSQIEKAGLQGVKLHPDFQRFNMDDSIADKMYEVCSGRLPILFHVGDYRQDFSSPERLANVMKKYPDLKVIAAHFGGWSVWERSIKALEPSENLYFDTSSSLSSIDRDIIFGFFEKYGVDKFFFGTDYPMWNISQEIEKIHKLGLSKEEEDCIFYKNAEKFLGLVT